MRETAVQTLGPAGTDPWTEGKRVGPRARGGHAGRAAGQAPRCTLWVSSEA